MNNKDPKFKIGDIVRISKNIFPKGCVPNSSEVVFVDFGGHMLLVILKAKKLVKRFTKKNWKKQIKKSLEFEKVITRKGDKLYVKWKDYDSSFNNWIDKKDRV